MSISGKGFFKIALPSGEMSFTRDGSFKLDPEGLLVTGQGYKIEPEIGPFTNEHHNISIGEDGIITASLENGDKVELGQVTLTYFPNPAGLEPKGNNMYMRTEASGEPIEDIIPGLEGVGTIQQGFLEGSNVVLVEEMMNLIGAQRAYEANSKSVTTVDDMLQIANQLKR